MKFLYTFVVFLLIQLALKYVEAGLGSNDMACENGVVVQYGHSFECKCNDGHVHETPNKCVKSDTLVACTAATVGKLCAEFARCVQDSTDNTKFNCECENGYAEKPAKTEGCLPALCKDKKCGNGVCVEDGRTAQCSCHINHKNKNNDKTLECETGGTHTCSLKCVEHAACSVHSDGYFFCECVNKKPMVNGACSNAITSFLSPFHVLIIIGVYIIYLKSA